MYKLWERKDSVLQINTTHNRANCKLKGKVYYFTSDYMQRLHMFNDGSGYSSHLCQVNICSFLSFIPLYPCVWLKRFIYRHIKKQQPTCQSTTNKRPQICLIFQLWMFWIIPKNKSTFSFNKHKDTYSQNLL